MKKIPQPLWYIKFVYSFHLYYSISPLSGYLSVCLSRSFTLSLYLSGSPSLAIYIVMVIIQTQTQTQTKFIQQKYIQVPYQVYMSFLEIQITL